MTAADERDVVGVIGGMGPAATSYFFDMLVERTPAEKDQDHLRIVVDSNPTVPDRMDHLLGDGPSPLPHIIEIARNLQAAGADVLTMPCNTSHAFHEDVSDAVDVPLLHMIALTADRVASTTDRVLLLATDGTIDLGLYHEHFQGRSAELVTPDEAAQGRVMEAIYDIKAGRVEPPRRNLVDAIDSVGDVDAVIAGCTELPVVLRPDDVDATLVDPMTVLADEAIARAKQELASPRWRSPSFSGT